ncbi:MAG: hypothetical protein IPL93_10110 [Actinomycetales bacterium]|nr:hypothetical protein [Actinomycetales bacterium]
MKRRNVIGRLFGSGGFPHRQNVPYDGLYAQLATARKVADYSLYAGFVFSLVLALKGDMEMVWRQLMGLLVFLALVTHFVANAVGTTVLAPSADRQRVLGLVEDSFDSPLLDRRIAGFYDNENLEPSLHKFLANTFQNVHESSRILRAQTRGVVGRTAAFGVVGLVAAYWGIKDSAYAIPVLQLLLSSALMTRMIHHLRLTSTLFELDEKFQLLFASAKAKGDYAQVHAAGLALAVDYQCALSCYTEASVSSQMYHRMNDALTQQWKVRSRDLGIDREADAG